MTDYKVLIKSLPKKQREVLDQICCENDSGHHPKTLHSLVVKGLINRFSQQIGASIIYRFNISSPAVHIAWCELCAEENPEELGEIAAS